MTGMIQLTTHYLHVYYPIGSTLSALIWSHWSLIVCTDLTGNIVCTGLASKIILSSYTVFIVNTIEFNCLFEHKEYDKTYSAYHCFMT